jgi:hypothetical protein
MARWWTVVVLVPLGLSGFAPAFAQAPPPLPAPPAGGAGVFAAEPVPPPPPDFCPPPVSLPNQDTAFTNRPEPTNAFADVEKAAPGPGVFFADLGPMALQRQRFGHGPIALEESPGVPAASQRATTAVFPAAGTPEALDFRDVGMDYAWGIQGSFGYHWDCDTVEVSGFMSFDHTTQATALAPGRVDVLFGAFPTPAGFAGANGTNVWLQADRVQAIETIQVGSVEANYRHRVNDYFEWIVGVRYVDLRENFDIVTTHGAVVATTGPTVVDYGIATENHMVGPQVGFNLEWMLIPGVSVGLVSKNAVTTDFGEIEHTLLLEPSTFGPGGSRDTTRVSGVFELGAYAQWWVNGNIRLRAGYQALWLVNVPDPVANISFNANDAQGNPNDHATIFFHGPSLDVLISF